LPGSLERASDKKYGERNEMFCKRARFILSMYIHKKMIKISINNTNYSIKNSICQANCG